MFQSFKEEDSAAEANQIIEILNFVNLETFL